MSANQQNQNGSKVMIVVVVAAIGVIMIGAVGALLVAGLFLTNDASTTPVEVQTGKEIEVNGESKRPIIKIKVNHGERASKASSWLDGNTLAGAAGKRGAAPYKPVSQYAEPGADSDVVTLEFDGKKGQGAASAPHLHDFDEAVVQQVMYERHEELIECYIEGLEKRPDMSGEVGFHFRVASDGRVALVRLTDSGLRDRTTEDCLVDTTRRWKFPKTGKSGLVKVDTSFEFALQ
jgi:hypothetical protein